MATSLAYGQPSKSTPTETRTYRVAQTFHVGGEGRWDYLTVDPEHKLLFVPRTTHTMVLDARTGKTVADIPGQKRNHGVAIAASAGRGFITDGEDASVTVFDLKTYAVLGKVKAAEDADGVIYDPASGKVLVVCGDAGVLIPISPDLDVKTGKADAAVELGGKPEFLAADGRGRAYINLVDKDQVAVVDTKTMKVVNKWPTAPGGSPVGMSMDVARTPSVHRMSEAAEAGRHGRERWQSDCRAADWCWRRCHEVRRRCLCQLRRRDPYRRPRNCAGQIRGSPDRTDSKGCANDGRRSDDSYDISPHGGI